MSPTLTAAIWIVAGAAVAALVFYGVRAWFTRKPKDTTAEQAKERIDAKEAQLKAESDLAALNVQKRKDELNQAANTKNTDDKLNALADLVNKQGGKP